MTTFKIDLLNKTEDLKQKTKHYVLKFKEKDYLIIQDIINMNIQNRQFDSNLVTVFKEGLKLLKENNPNIEDLGENLPMRRARVNNLGLDSKPILTAVNLEIDNINWINNFIANKVLLGALNYSKLILLEEIVSLLKTKYKIKND